MEKKKKKKANKEIDIREEKEIQIMKERSCV